VRPGVTVAGPVFVTARSALGGLSAVVALAELLAGTGSVVSDRTVAPFDVAVAVAAGSTAPVTVTVTDVPAATVPRGHSRWSVTTQPGLERSVSSAAGKSSIRTPAASDGPLFVIVKA
jgi:hypothetical protein